VTVGVGVGVGVLALGANVLDGVGVTVALPGATVGVAVTTTAALKAPAWVEVAGSEVGVKGLALGEDGVSKEVFSWATAVG